MYTEALFYSVGLCGGFILKRVNVACVILQFTESVNKTGFMY